MQQLHMTGERGTTPRGTRGNRPHRGRSVGMHNHMSILPPLRSFPLPRTPAEPTPAAGRKNLEARVEDLAVAGRACGMTSGPLLCPSYRGPSKP